MVNQKSNNHSALDFQDQIGIFKCCFGEKKVHEAEKAFRVHNNKLNSYKMDFGQWNLNPRDADGRKSLELK